MLKLRNQPVAKIMFVCMLLRNAYVTMNGSQVSEYLISLPPSFEHWVSQGPSARPLPMILFMILMMTHLRMKMNLINHLTSAYNNHLFVIHHEFVIIRLGFEGFRLLLRRIDRFKLHLSVKRVFFLLSKLSND